jgi:hypothetical protein
MQIENLIDINEICASHNIEISFIISLQKTGLIEIISVDDAMYIETEQLYQLEKWINLHYDLDINIEGIETINYLLDRISTLQNEIGELRNRLRLYEP